MKKVLKGLLLVVAAVALSICFVACNSNGNDKENNGGGSNTELRIETVYAAAVDLGFNGTLDDLIAAFKGDSAYTIAVSKGYTGSEADWLASLVGASGTNGEDGTDGVNGITPHIGENGNWFIGTTDTGLKAKGEDGTDGKSAYQIWLDNGHSGTEVEFLEWLKGQNGTDGADGLSTYEIFVKHNPDYLGDEGQWIDDYINGRLVRFTITFKAEGSEDIVKSVFYGYDLTDIPAVPEKVGNTGEWDRTDFTNITENITVTAVYKTKGLIFTLINNETEYKLTSANLDSDVNVLVIPTEYEGKPVTTIGYQAFMNQTSLTNVTIPNSVTLIEQRAFYGCTAIQAITIPFTGESATSTTNTHFGYIFGASSGSGQNNSIPSSLKTVVITNCKSIGDYAFLGCYSLTSVTIGGGVTSIGDYAFFSSYNLTSITIPDGVISIGDNAFSGCSGLTSVTIPDSVTSIGSSAFFGCSNLTSVTIPDSVTSIGSSAFENCNSLQFEIYNDNLKYLGNVLISTTSTAYKTVSLKPTTTVICYNAFFGCSNLTSVTIPDSVTSIGSSAFFGCSNLTNVYYKGTAEQWNSISIDIDVDGNQNLTSATRYYYSETQPESSGNYWHYDENNEIAIW